MLSCGVQRLRSLVVPLASRGCAGTPLGAFLRQGGFDRCSVAETQDVQASRDGRSFSWRVDVPLEWLKTYRRGEAIDSPAFSVGEGKRARLQFFPTGDTQCREEGMCSVWLWADHLGLRHRLRVGNSEREGGSAEFCRLSDAAKNGSVSIDLSLVDDAEGTPVTAERVDREQSLHMTGLEIADWRIHGLQNSSGSQDPVESPPFRMHHVLLGDMYLELHPGVPHESYGTVFFRCRVPTMVMKVNLEVGETFSKSVYAKGRSTVEQDMREGACLEINFEAPGVFDEKGDLHVRCTLEEVVSLPRELQTMIPRLNERVHWPKRV